MVAASIAVIGRPARAVSLPSRTAVGFSALASVRASVPFSRSPRGEIEAERENRQRKDEDQHEGEIDRAAGEMRRIFDLVGEEEGVLGSARHFERRGKEIALTRGDDRERSGLERRDRRRRAAADEDGVARIAKGRRLALHAAGLDIRERLAQRVEALRLVAPRVLDRGPLRRDALGAIEEGERAHRRDRREHGPGRRIATQKAPFEPPGGEKRREESWRASQAV